MKVTATVIATLLILTGCNPAPKDYVSSYDFSTARLVDLPWEMGATITGASASFDYDDYVREHHSDWNYVDHQLGRYLFDDLSSIPANSTNHVYTVDDPASIIPQYDSVNDSCRLIDGQLLHELECKDGVVMTSSNSWFKLGVEVLEYQDFNHDGYMDVLIKRTLAGSACPREELILSRKNAAGPFYVVDKMSGAVRIRTGESWSWEKNTDGIQKSQTHVHVDAGVTVADLAMEYRVSEEVIRSANGMGRDDEVQADTWVIVPDRE